MPHTLLNRLATPLGSATEDFCRRMSGVFPAITCDIFYDDGGEDYALLALGGMYHEMMICRDASSLWAIVSLPDIVTLLTMRGPGDLASLTLQAFLGVLATHTPTS